MLDPKELKIDAIFTLTDRQRSILTASVRQEHFDILQELMQGEVRRFNMRLLNTEPADRDAVAANHFMAVAILHWYVSFINRIKEECAIENFNAAKVGTPENPDNPMTEEDFR